MEIFSQNFHQTNFDSHETRLFHKPYSTWTWAVIVSATLQVPIGYLHSYFVYFLFKNKSILTKCEKTYFVICDGQRFRNRCSESSTLRQE